MKILICSDGTDPADKPAKIGGMLAGACQAATTLLGIAETPEEKEPLRAALNSEAELLRGYGVSPEIVMRAGEPIQQMLHQTAEQHYDVTVIGTRRKGSTGLYWYSEKTYEVIKAISPPVLVAIAERERLARFLVCTGGKRFIDHAVRLTGELALCTGASVTLLHVMAEPPAIYADLVRLEEDVDQLIASGSELGQNLQAQKETLEKLGVAAEIRVRHGIVLEQVFGELHEGHHDLIVAGSSQARGPLRHYIMGDLTRDILNRADCPVLVARADKADQVGGFWDRFRQLFRPATQPANTSGPANAKSAL
jgi:nucleotide-binding universal stress UspA family protein